MESEQRDFVNGLLTRMSPTGSKDDLVANRCPGLLCMLARWDIGDRPEYAKLRMAEVITAALGSY